MRWRASRKTPCLVSSKSRELSTSQREASKFALISPIGPVRNPRMLARPDSPLDGVLAADAPPAAKLEACVAVVTDFLESKCFTATQRALRTEIELLSNLSFAARKGCRLNPTCTPDRRRHSTRLQPAAGASLLVPLVPVAGMVMMMVE